MNNGRVFDIIRRKQEFDNIERWEMIILIYSHKPVIDNFLCQINVQGTVSAPKGWPQLPRAVIG